MACFIQLMKKITDKDADGIRRLWLHGAKPYELADLYKVSSVTVWRIVRGRRYVRDQIVAAKCSAALAGDYAFGSEPLPSGGDRLESRWAQILKRRHYAWLARKIEFCDTFKAFCGMPTGALVAHILHREPEINAVAHTVTQRKFRLIVSELQEKKKPRC